MIQINIPGNKSLQIKNLVLDYNGTVAVDGRLITGVKDRLNALADNIRVHVLTADTFGKCGEQLSDVNCTLFVLPQGGQDKGKLNYIQQLGAEHTVCVGNGRNDQLMLKESALGIAVILAEGAAVETVMAADVVCTDILSALDLLSHPLRLTATLRV
jgi:soluble P-type ATPase